MSDSGCIDSDFVIASILLSNHRKEHIGGETASEKNTESDSVCEEGRRSRYQAWKKQFNKAMVNVGCIVLKTLFIDFPIALLEALIQGACSCD